MGEVKETAICDACESVLQAALLRALASPWAGPDTTVREVSERAWAWLEAERRCDCRGTRRQSKEESDASFAAWVADKKAEGVWE